MGQPSILLSTHPSLLSPPIWGVALNVTRVTYNKAGDLSRQRGCTRPAAPELAVGQYLINIDSPFRSRCNIQL